MFPRNGVKCGFGSSCDLDLRSDVTPWFMRAIYGGEAGLGMPTHQIPDWECAALAPLGKRSGHGNQNIAVGAASSSLIQTRIR